MVSEVLTSGLRLGSASTATFLLNNPWGSGQRGHAKNRGNGFFRLLLL